MSTTEMPASNWATPTGEQEQSTFAPRSTLYGSRQAISSGHYLASAAGFAILEGGGNAIDAGCCAGICLAVLHPDEVNFGGVAPIMIRTGGGKVVTIAGLGHWPRSFPADLFMREHGGEMPPGLLISVVPAAADAWISALRDYGTMSFGEVAAAAIQYAKEGFAVFGYLASQIRLFEDFYRKWPTNEAIFMPNGRPPRVGERFYQSDLAGTLQYMVDEEAAARAGRVAGLEAARSAFYVGDIGKAIVEFHRENGGFISREDLAHFHSRYEEPVSVDWRGTQLFTCGPWCQGPALAHCLMLLDETRSLEEEHNSVEYIHGVVEVMKLAFADREYRYGDPQYVDVGLGELLSKHYSAERVKIIDGNRAMMSMPPPLGVGAAAMGVFHAGGGAFEKNPDTSYVCVMDRWGNAFSATPSDGSWKTPIVPGLGIIVSGRGTQSRPDPKHPSGIWPGKRPRLTPNPAIAVGGDGSVFPFGAPGGDVQVQAMLQVFLNVFHFGMDVQEAITAPRFATFSFPNSFAPFTYLPGRLNLEDRFSDGTRSALASMGHDVEVWPGFSRHAAAVEAILYDARTGFFRAGADPRQPAYAIVK